MKGLPPDYREKHLNLYYNYNTAFSNGVSMDEQFMLNPDTIPPKDFQWFYQSGGGSGRTEIPMDSLTVTDKDGNIIEFIDYRPKSFDPADPRTAATWTSYRDAQGNKHVVSADFFYSAAKDDLRNVAAVLNFTQGDPAQDAAVNRFLNNLQVYSQGYFSRFPQTRSFDHRI